MNNVGYISKLAKIKWDKPKPDFKKITRIPDYWFHQKLSARERTTLDFAGDF